MSLMSVSVRRKSSFGMSSNPGDSTYIYIYIYIDLVSYLDNVNMAVDVLLCQGDEWRECSTS